MGYILASVTRPGALIAVQSQRRLTGHPHGKNSKTALRLTSTNPFANLPAAAMHPASAPPCGSSRTQRSVPFN